jgi:hypothetical protein
LGVFVDNFEHQNFNLTSLVFFLVFLPIFLFTGTSIPRAKSKIKKLKKKRAEKRVELAMSK